MTESPAELAAVEQLLAESDALRGWLARLDQAPASAPDAVRQRVRGDYQQRLDQITAGLRAHADVITTKLHDDRGERAELQARATAAREALAEAELRHAVGEYDRSRFDDEQRRHQSDIETYQLSLDAVADRIARLEDIHALVQRAPRPPAIMLDGDLESAEPLLHDIELPGEGSDPLPINDLAPDAEDALHIFEEAAADIGDGAPESEPTRPMPDNGPLSFRPSGNGGDLVRAPVISPPRGRPFESAPPLGIPAADVPPRFVRPGDRFSAPAAPPATMSGESELAPEPAPLFGDEIVASGLPPELSALPVGRTLRCGECGAMNRPLEWYCEKCGAELTAM